MAWLDPRLRSQRTSGRGIGSSNNALERRSTFRMAWLNPRIRTYCPSPYRTRACDWCQSWVHWDLLPTFRNHQWSLSMDSTGGWICVIDALGPSHQCERRWRNVLRMPKKRALESSAVKTDFPRIFLFTRQHDHLLYFTRPIPRQITNN